MMLSAVAQRKLGKETSASREGWEQQRLQQHAVSHGLWSPQDRSRARRAGELPWDVEEASHSTNPTEHPTGPSPFRKKADYLPFFSAFLSLSFLSWFSFLSKEAKSSQQCIRSESFTPCTMDHFQSCWLLRLQGRGCKAPQASSEALLSGKRIAQGNMAPFLL